MARSSTLLQVRVCASTNIPHNQHKSLKLIHEWQAPVPLQPSSFNPPLLNRTASHGRRLSKRRMIAPAGGSSLDAQAAEEQPSSTGGARTKVAHQTSKDEEATVDEYDAATGMAAPAVADCSLSSHGSAMNVESLSDSAEKRLSALASSKRPSLLVPESVLVVGEGVVDQ